MGLSNCYRVELQHSWDCDYIKGWGSVIAIGWNYCTAGIVTILRGGAQ